MYVCGHAQEGTFMVIKTVRIDLETYERLKAVQGRREFRGGNSGDAILISPVRIPGTPYFSRGFAMIRIDRAWSEPFHVRVRTRTRGRFHGDQDNQD
jgi:hypothetical protein